MRNLTNITSRSLLLQSKKFLVTNLIRMDIRIYDAKSGELNDIHSDFIDNISNTSGDITTTIMDSKHRKIYIGDNKGGLSVFNINSGVLLSKL